MALLANRFLCRDLNLEFTGGIEQAFYYNIDKLNVHLVSSPDIAYSLKFDKHNQTTGSYGVNLGYEIWNNSSVYAGYRGTIATIGTTSSTWACASTSAAANNDGMRVIGQSTLATVKSIF